ncbi:MAG TPA: polymer-forming cytoskeletal protein [Longilinea sp.]|nr:polymer-forming cytoskeletal protein [Longilinea sp.]
MKTMYKVLIYIVLLVTCLALPATAWAQSQSGQVTSGDQFVIGRSFTLNAGDILNGNLVVVGGDAELAAGSTINGDVVFVGASANIGGTITGNVVCIGGSDTFTDTSVVDGNLTAVGGSQTISPNATIRGTRSLNGPVNYQVDLNPPSRADSFMNYLLNPISQVLWNVFYVLAMTALAALVALLFPRPTVRVADGVAAQPLIAIAVGLLGLPVYLVVFVVMCITLILIPVALISIPALLVALIFGWIGVGYEIGRRLAAASHQQWAEPLTAGIGTLVLGVVTAAIGWIPCLGWLVNFFIGLLGLGAIVISRFGTYPSSPATSISARATTVPPSSPTPPTEPSTGTFYTPDPPTPPVPPAPLAPAVSESAPEVKPDAKPKRRTVKKE